MDKNTTITTIDLIRHGEPVGGKKFRGSTDDPLSELGWQQMTAAVASTTEWDSIVASPLRRCRGFAESLSNKLNIPIHVEPNLREIGFGLWEGHTSEEIFKLFPGSLEKYWDNPEENTPPGGEAITDFHDRISTSWNNLVTDHTGKHILTVAHGGTIRAVLKHILQIPFQTLWRLEIEFASRTRIKIYHTDGVQTPVLVSLGVNPT